MNLDTILNTLQTLGEYGTIISTEQSFVLFNSLLLLKNENHFRNVFFWGQIYGTEKDYFIAYGFVKDALKGKIYYYSRNCLDWGLLPEPTDYAKTLIPLCSTRFLGDPSIVIDILIDKEETSLGKTLAAAMVRKLKEEDRLAATIRMINEDVCAVPRGALFERPDGVVVENLRFEGLSHLDAQELKCFVHFRQPRQKWNTNLLTRVDYNYAMDFLDPLDGDVPEGCWVIQLCAGDSMAMLKSLYWPGMITYHYINKPEYGFVYFGHGKKVMDLPFMLNPL